MNPTDPTHSYSYAYGSLSILFRLVFIFESIISLLYISRQCYLKIKQFIYTFITYAKNNFDRISHGELIKYIQQ